MAAIREVGGDDGRARAARGRPPGARHLRRHAGDVRARPGARRGHRGHRRAAGRRSTRLRADVVPHMGWNTVDAARGLGAVRRARATSASTSCTPTPRTTAPGAPTTTAEHGEPFVAAVEHGALSATQFHPEKSGDGGPRPAPQLAAHAADPGHPGDAVSLVLLPAVDVADGQAVRLVQGEAGSETSYGDPLEAARAWQEGGAEWVHLVDLDAAFGRGSNAPLLARVVGELDVQVEMSGGIRDDASLEAALATGCARVNLGTAALEQPEWCASAIAAPRRPDRRRPRRARHDAVGPRLDAGRRRPVGGARPPRRRGLRPLRRHRRPARRHAHRAQPRAARARCARAPTGPSSRAAA